jgi:hypothetical protein
MARDERAAVHNRAATELQDISRTAVDPGLRAAAIHALVQGRARKPAFHVLQEQATNQAAPNFAQLAVRLMADNFGAEGALWLLELDRKGQAGTEYARAWIQLNKAELQRRARSQK